MIIEEMGHTWNLFWNLIYQVIIFLKALIVDVDYGVPEIPGISGTCVVTLVSCLVPVSVA